MSEESKTILAPEEKIQKLIDEMREALAQEGVPQFKAFWEARGAFHEALKECKNPLFKSKMWKELSEMTAEARRIKEILDEEARFSMEQLELAIKAFGEDVQKEVEGVGPDMSKYALDCKGQQKQISTFSLLLTRLKELRGEVIQTEMRVKHKNRLLKEISAIGDSFIPKRKELIDGLSDYFMKDVEKFYVQHFEGESRQGPPLRVLREEIKEYQRAAKEFSINSRAFKETREVLSKAWDTLSKRSDEKKQIFEQRREVFVKNLEEVKAEAVPFLEKKEWTLVALICDYNHLLKVIEGKELDRRDKQTLLSDIEKVYHERKTILDGVEAEKRAKEAAEKQKVRLAFEKSVSGASKKSLEALKKLREELVAEGKAMRDLVEAVDLAILKKDGKGGGALQQWHELEKSHRKQLDELRKKMGQSGFDFEKAMEARAEFDAKRARLTEIEEEIKKLK